MPHFFASRTDGVNESQPDKTWRYGKGNVFSPSEEDPEAHNAYANISAILEQKGFPTQQGVMLQSQYGKGISVVNEDFLNNPELERDPTGRIILKGDGLFTTLPNIPLLNKSGDAHAILFESEKAIGIIVGSWHCIKKGIIKHMMEYFLKVGINPEDITIHVGPGLGANSYSVQQEAYDEICNEFPDFAQAFRLKGETSKEEISKLSSKEEEPDSPQKYVMDFPKLVRLAAQYYGIKQVEVSESQNTFDKPEWKKAKENATSEQDPQMLIDWYRERPYFSARNYTRVDRQIRRIADAASQPLPEGLQPNQSTYGGTGRNLNAIMLKV